MACIPFAAYGPLGILVQLQMFNLPVGWALDYPISQSPTVSHEQLGDREVLWCDWGAAGSVERRDAELIGEEQEALRRWLHSPELLGPLTALAQLGRTQESALLRQDLAAWRLAYTSNEHPTGVPRATCSSQDEVPLPIWAWGIPVDIRRGVQLLLFDDRDPAQRMWVLARARSTDRLTIAYCTGWRTGDDRDAYWRGRPGIAMSPIASDEIAAFYGVIAYPAAIRFEDETMSVQQGLDDVNAR